MPLNQINLFKNLLYKNECFRNPLKFYILKTIKILSKTSRWHKIIQPHLTYHKKIFNKKTRRKILIRSNVPWYSSSWLRNSPNKHINLLREFHTSTSPYKIWIFYSKFSSFYGSFLYNKINIKNFRKKLRERAVDGNFIAFIMKHEHLDVYMLAHEITKGKEWEAL